MTVLLYCVNDGKIEDPEIDTDSICWVKADYAVNMVRQYSSKVSDSKKKQQVLDIADKIEKP